MYRSETYNKPTPRFWLYVNAASAVVLVLLYVLTPRIGVGNWIYYHLNPPPEGDGTLYLPLHEFFQDDLDLPNPVFNTPKLRQYMPHNWRGEGQKTFATYLSTRNGSLHDPYFAAAQQLVYRMLWDPEIKSEHTFTVFVAPFIPVEQRDLLSAAGAVVRELDLISWEAKQLTNGRWRDLFSKLNIWGQTDFSRIVLLDTDAFPIENIDGIFDVVEPQECVREKLVDLEQVDEACHYLFSAVQQQMGDFNGGVLIVEPNAAMHARLLRHMFSDDYLAGTMEQSFLNEFFRQDGPFPAQLIDREWNGFVPQEDEEGKLKVFHDKLWKINEWTDRNLTWAENYFDDSWSAMIDLYEGQDFMKMREQDGARLYTYLE